MGRERLAKRTAWNGAMIVLLAAVILIVSMAGDSIASAYALLGENAPPFKIQSGDDKSLTSESLKGKVIVIFYETKGASRKNSDVKDRFNALYDRQNEATRRLILRVPVFDCSRVIWPATALWKQGLRYHSKRVGITLYGDWDGRMARDYQMKDEESNLIIIDRKGIVRYVSEGRIDDRQFLEIEQLLDELVNRES